MSAPALLVATTAAAAGGERVLDPTRTWTIGRGADADVVVDDGLVSRRHLVLEPTGAGWTVHDVSSNGTWVRGTRVAGGFTLPASGSEQVRLGGPGGPVVTLAPTARAAAPAVGPSAVAVPAVGPPVAPSRPPRRRRRGVGWLVALLVLIVLLVVGDRVAAAVAGNQAVKQIVQQSQGLQAEPSVSFRGFPFLTQVVTGTYRDIHVRLDDVRPPDAPRIDRIEVDLRGAKVPLSSVLNSSLSSIPVDRVDGTVEVTLADLNAYLAKQAGGLVLTAKPGGAIGVTGAVDFEGTSTDISGSAKLGAADGGLVVTPVDLQVGGDDPLGGLGLDLGSLVPAIPVPLDGLPFDLRVTGVDVEGGRIDASAQASHVVLEVPQ